MKDRKERLKELLDEQKQKGREEEEKRDYETVLEEVNELFPKSEEKVEILSKEESKKIIDELYGEFPFCNNGIEWTRMYYKTIFSNFIDYESALAELVIKNHKVNNEICYIIDLNFQHIIKTKLIRIIHRVEEVRNWDRFIYSPQIKLVIEFTSNDIAVGWKI
ncbi:hypothetical protein [Lysinibacillus cavernae]|uniref:CDI toxin immunity protein n=1 Tax=Lysinibacillus cavernae TaxID=2666135 RepID=UPI0012D942DE|nr:hypothetical protein [Lysinibacillus cavernae]